MICPKCGYNNSSENMYCGQCGIKLDSKRNNGRILPVIIVAVCAAVVMLMIVLLISDVIFKAEPSMEFNEANYMASEAVESTANKIQEKVTTPVESLIEPEPETIVETQSTQPTIPDGYISFVDGGWENITLKDGNSNINTHAFVFSQELIQCSELTINLEVSMKAGTKCKEWQLWGRVDEKFQKIAKISLPDGDGSTSQTVKFDNPISFDAIVVTPTVVGGYSWSLGLSVTDVWVAE